MSEDLDSLRVSHDRKITEKNLKLKKNKRIIQIFVDTLSEKEIMRIHKHLLRF